MANQDQNTGNDFLKSLDKKLWTAADKLRVNLDAAVYKHAVLGLINLIAEIPFQHEDLDAKDILGHVYEYFLGQFALAEGKKGGQYYTPKSIVNLIVEMLEPFKGRVYDPAMNMVLLEEDRNAEARRTLSYGPRTSSALSASLRFKILRSGGVV